MDEEYRRRKHRRLPPSAHRTRGPVAFVGAQRALAVPVSVRNRLQRLARGGPIGPVSRWAYALGRAALMSRWVAGDRWDLATVRGGRGRVTGIALPRPYIIGWPQGLGCSHGAACRLALDIGIALLEFELAATGIVQLLDERSVEIIAAAHHPGRYCCPEAWTTEPEEEPGRFKSGATWLG